MKKIISLLAIVAMVAVLATAAFANEDCALLIKDVEATAGAEVVMNIEIVNNPGITVGEFIVEFDETALELVSMKAVGGEDWDWDAQVNKKSGKVVFTAGTPTDDNGDFIENYTLTGDVTLITLTLKVKEGTLPGSYEVKAVVDFIGDDNGDFIVGTDFTGAVNVLCVDHVAGDVVIENVVESTCTVAGSHDEVTYCTICGVELSRQTVADDKLAHTAGETVVENEVPATCKAAGSYDEVVYCSVCGEELSRTTVVVDQLAHTPAAPVIENETEGTCLLPATHEEVVYCSVCGEELSRTTVEGELGDHVAAEAVKENVEDADCVTPGSYDLVVYCAVCGEEMSREHVEGELGDHVAGEVVIENEVAGTDCQNPGSYDEVVYCTICGEELSRETKAGTVGEHQLETVVTEPTCCEDGLSVVKCALCGHVVEETVLNATGEHTLTYVDNADGKTHNVVCANSGKVLNVEDHTYGEFVDDPENEGWKYTVCEKCGYVHREGATPPPTGDYSMIAVVVAALSITGIAVVASKKKEF